MYHDLKLDIDTITLKGLFTNYQRAEGIGDCVQQFFFNHANLISLFFNHANLIMLII